MTERLQAIREMRQRHSAKSRLPEMKARLKADVHRALARASASSAAGLSAEEYNDAVRQVLEAITPGMDGELAKRDRRIVEALADLIPLLEEMRSIARETRSDDRAARLHELTKPLERWRRRFDATDSAQVIVAWLIDGDREPHQKGPKKRAAGIAFKVIAKLPWTNRIAPTTVERIYRKVVPPPKRIGWWKKGTRLSEPAGTAARPTRPLSIRGARPKSRTR